MTEKEIVQALRCCKLGVPCEKCPVVGNKDCSDEVNTAAADLIERLTAENAALKCAQLDGNVVVERRGISVR